MATTVEPKSDLPQTHHRIPYGKLHWVLIGTYGLLALVIATAAMFLLSVPTDAPASNGAPWIALGSDALRDRVVSAMVIVMVVLIVGYSALVFVILRARLRANAALVASEQRLASYLDALPFSVQVHDPHLNPIYVNSAIRQRNPNRDAAFYQEHYGSWVENVPVVVTGTNTPYPYERLPLVRAMSGNSCHADDVSVARDGHYIAVEVWSVPIHNATGEVTAIVTAFQDIGARLAIERELASYREQLEQHVAQRTAELAAVNAHLTIRVAQLSAINDISRSLMRMDDFATTLQEVARILVDLYAVQGAMIGLSDAEKHQIWLAAVEDRSNGRLLPYFGKVIPYVPADIVAAYTAPYVVDNVEMLSALPLEIRRDLMVRGANQIVLAPLIARDQVFGVIALMTDDPLRKFTADELRVAQTIATLVAGAVDTLHFIAEARQASTPEQSWHTPADPLFPPR